MLSGLKSTTSAKIYSLLSEIFKAWPKPLPLLASESGPVAEANSFGSLQLLLKLGGLDDISCAAGSGNDSLFDAIQKAALSSDKVLSPVAQTLISACAWYFSKTMDTSTSSPGTTTMIPKEDITMSVAGDCMGGGTGREFKENLLNDGTEDWNKWLHESETSWVQYDFNEGKYVAEYTLCSANDCPSRDPVTWKFEGLEVVTDSWVTLHEVDDENVFQSRWEWQRYQICPPQVVKAVRLMINRLRSPGNACQLGHFHVYTAEQTALPQPQGEKKRKQTSFSTDTDTHIPPENIAPLRFQVSRVSSKASSSSEGNMLLDGGDKYWESNGSKPHWFELDIAEGNVWTDLMLFTYNYESYSPATVNVKVGSTVVKSGINLGKGTVYILVCLKIFFFEAYFCVMHLKRANGSVWQLLTILRTRDTPQVQLELK